VVKKISSCKILCDSHILWVAISDLSASKLILLQFFRIPNQWLKIWPLC
jgi:hypothetical protein